MCIRDRVRTRSGCYSRVHPGTELRIISLNTNYWCVQLARSLGVVRARRRADRGGGGGTQVQAELCDPHRRFLARRFSSADPVSRLAPTVWLYDSDVPIWDPNGILSWLAEELDAAEQAGQRAWISASCPLPFPCVALALAQRLERLHTQSDTCRLARSTRCVTRATTPTRSSSGTTTRSRRTFTGTGARALPADSSSLSDE